MFALLNSYKEKPILKVSLLMKSKSNCVEKKFTWYTILNFSDSIDEF